MNVVRGCPTLQFFKGLAEIFDHLPVCDFHFARCREQRCAGGDGVDDQADLPFALMRPCFGPFAFVDIGEKDVPAGDSPALSKRQSLDLKPAIDAVEPTDPAFEIVRFT